MATNDEIDPIGILDLPEQVIDPDNPNWHILDVLRGIDDNFLKIWKLCQKHRALIIGGYVRYMISPVPEPALANDIDIFLQANDDDRLKDIEERYEKLRVEFAALYDFETEGPLSWYYSSDGMTSVNLIRPRIDDAMVTVGTIYEIIGMMDFPVVRCGLKSLGEAIADPDFVKDEIDRKLHWRHINCPLAAVYRVIKYAKKGYFVQPKELIKLFIDWEERDELYKAELTAALQKIDPSEEDIMKLEALLYVD